MVKAKLIENKNYYTLRRKQLILTFVPSMLAGLVVIFHLIPVWVTVLLLGLFVVAIILTVRNLKQIHSVFGKKWIEMDREEIRIKSKKGIVEETISLHSVERIILKDEYSMPQETIKDFGNELAGNAKQNYVILHQNSQERKLDFDVDSYYMVHQLIKLIESWKMKGYSIEIINQK